MPRLKTTMTEKDIRKDEKDIRKDERQQVAAWIRATCSVWAEGERQLLEDLADQIEQGDHQRFFEIVEAQAANQPPQTELVWQGPPCIRGTRFPVSQLLEALAVEGETLESICAEFDYLDIKATRDALRWAVMNMPYLKSRRFPRE